MSELILVGGCPGTGKSTIGRLLAKTLGYVLVDLDSATCAMTEGLLMALGCDKNDRESEPYVQRVKPLEYETILNIAQDNLDIGRSIICTAPFTSLFRDPQWIDWIETSTAVRDATLSLVWLTADTTATRSRIIHRNADRDQRKLDSWEKYSANLPAEPPSDTRIMRFDNTQDNDMDSVVMRILKELEKQKNQEAV